MTPSSKDIPVSFLPLLCVYWHTLAIPESMIDTLAAGLHVT